MSVKFKESESEIKQILKKIKKDIKKGRSKKDEDDLARYIKKVQGNLQLASLMIESFELEFGDSGGREASKANESAQNFKSEIDKLKLKLKGLVELQNEIQQNNRETKLKNKKKAHKLQS